MTKLKRIITILISLLFITYLIACSGGNTTNEGENNNNQNNSEDVEIDTNEATKIDEDDDEYNNLDYQVATDNSTELENVTLLEGFNDDGIIENYRLVIENLTEDIRYYKVTIVEYENVEVAEEQTIFDIEPDEKHKIDYPVIDIKMPSKIRYEWKASLSKDNLD
jgi:hypothetical protein